MERLYKPIRRAELVKGGYTIKQGEIFTLGFQLFDADGTLITLTSEVVTVKVANRTGVIHQTNATIVGDRIEFTVSENIGYGKMRVEFKVSDGAEVLQKYPADGWIELTITASLDDLNVGGLDTVTSDEMFAEIAIIEGVAANALTVSQSADGKSTNAVAVANEAKEESAEALTKSINAETIASTSNEKSTNAESLANQALSESASANTKSTNAETIAKEAKTRADLIIGQAGESNTEIVDMRIGADLVVRPTSGTLVREIHAQQLETARQTTTLINGVSVVTGGVDALAETEIEGRTLITLANSNLEATKKYVLADKKTKVLVDGVTQSGVAKFTKGTTTVSTANFVNKAIKSTVINPHYASVGNGSTLVGVIGTDNLATYSGIDSLNGANFTWTSSPNGSMAQIKFSFDIIAEIERKLGLIPKSTLAEKVQWVKDNVESIVANWHGFGSSPLGNKATVKQWTGSTWSGASVHTMATVFGVGRPIDVPNIDSNGFVHVLAHAEASDGVTASSISTDYIDLVVTLKATAQLNTRPTIIRVENFEGKVTGSVAENPHIAKRGYSNTLQPPTSAIFNAELNPANINSLNSVVMTSSTSVIGEMAQQPFSFNLIEAVERNIGKITRTSVADKVQWLKDNVSKLTSNWHGFGSSVGGNKASFTRYVTDGTWSGATQSTNSPNVTKLTFINANLSNSVDTDGFIYFLAYAEPSDGITASTINTDYIDLEIELKPTADFTRPKVALYEVPATDYAKILVDWSADEVVNRYPIVEGVQHLQGVGVVAEGENLIDIFEELSKIAPTQVNRLEGNEIEVLPNLNNFYLKKIGVFSKLQQYTLSFDIRHEGANVGIIFEYVYTDGTITTLPSGAVGQPYSSHSYVSTQGKSLEYIRLTYGTSLTKTFIRNFRISVGTVAKPFVPRNPSYLYADVKLGAIGTVADRLYEQDGAKFVRKVVEKDVVLDGSLAWTPNSSLLGYKNFKLTGIALNQYFTVTGFKGNTMKYVPYANRNDGYEQTAFLGSDIILPALNSDTGFAEAFTPSGDNIKRYFNGWKYSDGVTWISVTGNGQTATGQVALDTKPTDYTPYKLSYVLATPQVINVTDKVEGQLKVNGLTQVEALSGIVRREKVVPSLSQSIYYINGTSASKLKSRVNKILGVYKNGILDTTWSINNHNSLSVYGRQFAPLSQADFDPTAEYTVTYVALDKPLLTANPTNIKLMYANNIRSSLEDTVGKVQDNTTQLSVHEKAIVDLYVRMKALGG